MIDESTPCQSHNESQDKCTVHAQGVYEVSGKTTLSALVQCAQKRLDQAASQTMQGPQQNPGFQLTVTFDTSTGQYFVSQARPSSDQDDSRAPQAQLEEMANKGGSDQPLTQTRTKQGINNKSPVSPLALPRTFFQACRDNRLPRLPMPIKESSRQFFFDANKDQEGLRTVYSYASMIQSHVDGRTDAVSVAIRNQVRHITRKLKSLGASAEHERLQATYKTRLLVYLLNVESEKGRPDTQTTWIEKQTDAIETGQPA